MKTIYQERSKSKLMCEECGSLEDVEYFYSEGDCLLSCQHITENPDKSYIKKFDMSKFLG